MSTSQTPTPTPEPTNNQPAATPPASTPTTGETSPSASTGSPADPSTDLSAAPQPAGETTDLGAAAAKPEEPAVPGAAFQGAPEGDYTVNLPDGTPLDQELMGEALPIARELNLNQAGVDKLVQLKLQDNQRALQRWSGHLKQLKTEAMADTEIGGSNYAPAIARAQGVIAKYGDPELRKVFNDYGIGAHRAMIRFLSKIGAATQETPSVSGGAAVTGSSKQLHDLMYKD